MKSVWLTQDVYRDGTIRPAVEVWDHEPAWYHVLKSKNAKGVTSVSLIELSPEMAKRLYPGVKIIPGKAVRVDVSPGKANVRL